MARVRGIDLAWLLFLGGLAAAGMTRSEHSIWEFLALLALGAIQMAESQVETSAETGKAAVAIATKLILCCLLVWQTGGIESSYYLIFLLPVVSGASRYGLGGTIAITVLSSGLYLSFLLGVDCTAYYIDAGGWRELAVRTLFLFLSAVLANRLMTENRLKTERLTQAYRELSEAQAEVRRSERLAALGQLSAGLAHEIRNPLGVISASAELLDKHVAQDNKVAREVSGFIRSEVNRTNLLVTPLSRLRAAFAAAARNQRSQRGRQPRGEAASRGHQRQTTARRGSHDSCRHSEIPVRRALDRELGLQPVAQRLRSDALGRCAAGAHQPQRRDGRDRSLRQRRRHSPRAVGERFQSVFHDQAARSRPRPGDGFEVHR